MKVSLILIILTLFSQSYAQQADSTVTDTTMIRLATEMADKGCECKQLDPQSREGTSCDNELAVMSHYFQQTYGALDQMPAEQARSIMRAMLKALTLCELADVSTEAKAKLAAMDAED